MHTNIQPKIAWETIEFPAGYADFDGMELKSVGDIDLDGVIKPVSAVFVASDDVIFNTPSCSVAGNGSATDGVMVPPIVASGSYGRYWLKCKNTSSGANQYVRVYKDGANLQAIQLSSSFDGWKSVDFPIVAGSVYTLVVDAYTEVYAWTFGCSASLVESYNKSVWVAAQS